MGISVVSTPETAMKNSPVCILPNRLCIKSQGRFVFVDMGSIRWLESAGNYVHIRVAGQPAEDYLVRCTLQSLEGRLDERHFVRIHRSVIVNCRRIRELRPWYTGEYIVTLDNGKELTLSRSYRGSLNRLLTMSAAS
jgi:two-component system, LytTR family, response regulator